MVGCSVINLVLDITEQIVIPFVVELERACGAQLVDWEMFLENQVASAEMIRMKKRDISSVICTWTVTEKSFTTPSLKELANYL